MTNYYPASDRAAPTRFVKLVLFGWYYSSGQKPRSTCQPAEPRAKQAYEQAKVPYEHIKVFYEQAKVLYKYVRVVYEQAQVSYEEIKVPYQTLKVSYEQTQVFYEHAKVPVEQTKVSLEHAKVCVEQPKVPYEHPPAPFLPATAAAAFPGSFYFCANKFLAAFTASGKASAAAAKAATVEAWQ